MDDQAQEPIQTNDEVADEVTDAPEQTNETTDLVEETNEPTQVEQTTVEAEQTVESPEYEDEEEDSYTPFSLNQNPANPAPQLDLSQIPLDADGNYDANALAQAINNQLAAANQVAQQATNMVVELEEKRREEQLWQKAMDKYPELKSDKQLAQEVDALRYGLLAKDVMSGNSDARLITPAKAAERVLSRFQAAKTEGMKTATESVKVQESAYIEPTSSGQTVDAGGEEALFQKMRSPDRFSAEQAQAELLKKRLFGN
jgi:hypothetical protein